KIVVPFLYKDVTSFKEGVAFVRQADKWALINQNGDFLSDFVINQPGTFRNGKADIDLGEGRIVTINAQAEVQTNNGWVPLPEFLKQ
ncbi:MAG: WG repeat-containing protein, partial [Bacteroidota bacterium]